MNMKNWLKNNWKIILVVILSITLVWLYFRRQNTSFASKLQELNKNNIVEITKINAIHDAELKQLLKNNEILQSKLNEIEASYQEEKQVLTKKQVVTQKRLVENYISSPDELDADVANVLNVVIK